MNWRNVKTLLLLLLIAANLFLFSVVRGYYAERARTDEATAKDAADLLMQSDLFADSTLFAVRGESAKKYACAYDRENYLCLTAMLFFGKEADGIYLLPDGIRAEDADGSAAALGYDLSVHYLRAGTNEDAVRAAQNALSGAVPDDGMRKKLKDLLFFTDRQIDALTCKVSADGYRFVTVNQTVDGLPVYGFTCTFAFFGENLVFAEGKYFFDQPTAAEEAPLLGRTHILFSEKERGRTGRLTSLSLCLAPYEDTENGSLLFLPAYALTFADGTFCAVNALDGTLYS